MRTKQIYYENSYITELEGKVISVEPANNLTNVILDQTIFYPEGGGQPSDRGTLGSTKVEYVRISDGEIIHQVKGEIKPGEKVKGLIDWNWRLKYMKIHSAGHLLHDVLMTLVKELRPDKASHGKKAFIEYQGELDPTIKDKLEVEVYKIAQQNLAIVTRDTTIEELRKVCPYLPINLPSNKSLRMIKIGGYPPMPDGGVHVKSTKEIGKIWIANINVQNGTTSIRYGVI